MCDKYLFNAREGLSSIDFSVAEAQMYNLILDLEVIVPPSEDPQEEDDHTPEDDYWDGVDTEDEEWGGVEDEEDWVDEDEECCDDIEDEEWENWEDQGEQ